MWTVGDNIFGHVTAIISRYTSSVTVMRIQGAPKHALLVFSSYVSY